MKYMEITGISKLFHLEYSLQIIHLYNFMMIYIYYYKMDKLI